jgi:phenylpropionate dioxygenase-like ring-hydroxylating dioxygenase large terminal subunit
MNTRVSDICKRFETFHEALPNSTREKIPVLWKEGKLGENSADISTRRIVSRESHELEKKHIWSKVWQFVCREEHIPNVGDQHVYDICDKSYLIVRTAPDVINAFVNSCLHRGRLLREYNGNANEIRCPFHSFRWNLDGSIRAIPCRSEFTHRSKDDWALPKAKVAIWEGFVFINPDPNAESLETYLGELPQHFARWHLSDRFVAAHVSKVIGCNWKVAQEAFMESFHVTTTHPQASAAMNDQNSINDAFGNISRAMALFATPSPLMSGEVTNQEVVDAMLERLPDEPPIMTVPQGLGAREFMGEAQRERLRATIGDQVDELEQTELVDIFYYSVFPNFHPWGAFNELVYRFRPNGDEHRESIMEVLYLQTFKAGERPPPAVVTHLDIRQEFVEATELGNLARIFDQDVFNLPKVQRGLEASAKGFITLTAYQELKIRHFYELHKKLVREDLGDQVPPRRPELS